PAAPSPSSGWSPPRTPRRSSNGIPGWGMGKGRRRDSNSLLPHQEGVSVREAAHDLWRHVGELVPVGVGVFLEAFEAEAGGEEGVDDLAESPLALVLLCLLVGGEGQLGDVGGGPALVDVDALGE